MKIDHLPGEKDPVDWHWAHLEEQVLLLVLVVLIVEAEPENLQAAHSLGLWLQVELRLAQEYPDI